MLMRKGETSSGGIGLFGATFLVFLILKLTGHIDWSWWLVTAPLWGPLALVFVSMVIAMVIAVIGAILEKRR